jgi:hypothetical protein
MSRCTVSIKLGRDLRTSCRNRVINNKLTSVFTKREKKRELVNVSSFKVSTYGIKNMEHAWIKALKPFVEKRFAFAFTENEIMKKKRVKKGRGR